jgi:hypothetical protein
MEALAVVSWAAALANSINFTLKLYPLRQPQAAKQEFRKLSQNISSVRFEVQKYIDTGFQRLFDELLPSGFSWDAILSIWDIIRSLLLAAQELLNGVQKRLKLWDTLLYLMLFFCFFSVFPNNFRHSCTTMPWTIWPALVVLWGACWMFYEPSAGNGDEFADLIVENNTLSPYPGECCP